MKKYTLDQIVSEQYVFLKRPEEENRLVIRKEMIAADLKEGDIVFISEMDGSYDIQVLKEETEDARDKVKALLEKLQNKNN